MNKTIRIYADGACKGNPGKGGWAYIMVSEDLEFEHSGYEHYTTNNRMELKAVIEGLKLTKPTENIQVFTDSAYVVNCFEKDWRTKWERNNWLTSKKTEVSNSDLWKELFSLVDSRSSVKFIKVKGHSGNKYNEIVDKLACRAAERRN